jgi:hypothetical protein
MTRSERQNASFVTCWHRITQSTKPQKKLVPELSKCECSTASRRLKFRRRNSRNAFQVPSAFGKTPAAVSTVSKARFRVYVQSSALAMLLHTNCKSELFARNDNEAQKSNSVKTRDEFRRLEEQTEVVKSNTENSCFPVLHLHRTGA